QVGLLEVMEMAKLLGFEAEVVIIGVEPKEIDWGLGLSPEVKEKLQKVISLALEEIRGA
ncbi:MAG: Ni,Fe-hydrogenase maturation factor, partial [Deltaproteobacteria bacterium]